MQYNCKRNEEIQYKKLATLPARTDHLPHIPVTPAPRRGRHQPGIMQRPDGKLLIKFRYTHYRSLYQGTLSVLAPALDPGSPPGCGRARPRASLSGH